MRSLRYLCVSTILLSAMALAQSTPASGTYHGVRVSPSVSSSSLPSKGLPGARRTTSAQLSFGPYTTYGSGGSEAWGVTVGDVNGDGKADIVVGNFCPTAGSCDYGEVGVLLGNGDGTFQPAVSYNSGGFQANAIVIADVNGDGKPDIVVANWCSDSTCVNGSVGVLLGNGNGSFQPAVAYDTGQAITVSVAVADLRGDGKLDIVTANSCDCANDVSVFLGNGDGTFQAAVAYDTGGVYTASVAVADVNGDGIPDLIAETAICNGQLSCPTAAGVLLGNGDGTFQTVATYGEIGVGPISVTVGDMNGDGHPDLVSANCGANPDFGCGEHEPDGVVDILLNNGDGTFTLTENYDSGGWGTSTARLADVNGDGYLDVIALDPSSNYITVLLGSGNGTLQWPQIPFSVGSGGSINDASQGLAIADVNGDGRPDVIVVQQGTVVGVLLNTSIYPTTTTLTSSPNPSTLDQSVTFTATIVQQLLIKPTGTVTFYNGVNSLGSATLSSSGTANLAISTLGLGTQSITATYSGDSNFASSTSPVLSQVVQEAVVQLSPTSINFGDQTVGTASAPQTVTLTNTGNGPLTITKVAVTGSFTQTNTCGSSVAAGASCTLTVKFKPATSGAQTGSISIVDNAAGSPQKIKLAGTGTDLRLNPTSLNFGDQAVGTKSPAKKITLSNRSTVAVTITAISITGTDSENFSESNNCGASVAAGASCTISVTFTPSADGQRTAEVSVSDTGGGSPQTVSLSGTGTGS